LRGKPRETANVGAGLWKEQGMWAWLLFRASGLLLVLYLFAHIVITSLGHFGGTGESNAYTQMMEFFEHPVAIVLDLLLVAVILYHAFNGVRVILMDFGVGIQRHKIVFWTCMAVTVICFAFFAYVAIDHLVNTAGGGS
jgi:succinate dehydrogenase / fumarate reductase cytochrome b subunit